MRALYPLTILLLLAFSCKNTPTSSVLPGVNPIRINQIGFYPEAVKEFVLADYEASKFQVIGEKGKVVFEGDLVDRGKWEASGEQTLLGDFSDFKTPGKYKIQIAGNLVSAPFEIKEQINLDAFNAAIKSFYYQRASMPVEAEYGGTYQRAAGHPDEKCAFHPSTGRSGVLNSPGGWYDAGDYGKYVVNASISAGQMLELVELYPRGVKDGQLNIPESGNGDSDLLDEINYELDWISTMQDEDGGVFHKLTAKTFSGFIMPEAYDLERFIIGKGTAASLNFAAVMAKAARICKLTYPEWAETALSAAEKAWDWSVANDNIPFKNPEDVKTGEYGDKEFSDDFYWAAAELYLTTKKEDYFNYLLSREEPVVHQLTNSWKFFIRNMGFHALLANRNQLNPEHARSLIDKHLRLADGILADIEENPYHVGVDHFEWGSNSDFLNQAMILCYAHLLTGDSKYLEGAIRNVDYIFGKNATGYCFLTGFGAKRVMFPHHRPSGADGVADPVPGFILGGPNKDKQDRQYVDYQHDAPAKSFEDVEPSFASNEVCLNWNAPAVFVLGYLEQVSK